jgi:predicted O-linked N-acetylglucosamine transferase (SPINDLY family)
MRILSAVPASVLWLLDSSPETMDRLRAHAASRGVAAERLIFGSRMSTPNHVARYRIADLFLDTTPYGAHTTASDALWAGLPILTFMGRSFPARVCGSLVHAAGLHELVCDSPEAYEREAIRIGLNTELRHGLKQKLRMMRARCTLFDTPRLVRHLEQLYAQMWQAYCRGALPVPDLANLPLYHEIGCEVDHETSAGFTDEIYRTQLDYRHATTRLPSDGRLWTSPPVDLARAA